VIASDDSRAGALRAALDAGDLDALRDLLDAEPGLAAERFGDGDESRTPLLIATDWPGRRPRAAESIAMLVAAGADVGARFVGAHRETPLHWAASCDDVEAIDALLDAGADLEADGAVLTGGTPLADAVVFAQWNAARRLVERGASMTIWQAAALGELDALRRFLDAGTATPADITNACWHACRAGQLPTAQALAARGADLDWLGHDGLTVRAAGLQSGDEAMARWLGDA